MTSRQGCTGTGVGRLADGAWAARPLALQASSECEKPGKRCMTHVASMGAGVRLRMSA
jgi:hypothetical protein